jgi:hypothetical protein
MGIRKKLFGWCPQPVNPISMTLKRHSVPLAVLTATLLLVSFFIVYQNVLVHTPPSPPELPPVTSTPSPIPTPTTTASPAPSASPLPSPTPSPTLAPWPASNQPPSDRSAQALTISDTYDPTGDTFFYPSVSQANGSSEIDIVYAQVMQIDASHLQFSMTLAGNIQPPYSQSYEWGLDTDMNSSTGGHANFLNDLGTEHSIYVGVPGIYADAGIHTPTAEILPMSTHEDIPWSQVTVSGNTITVTVSLSDIGNPTSFNWVAFAFDSGVFDKAPNSGHMTLIMGGGTDGNS